MVESPLHEGPRQCVHCREAITWSAQRAGWPGRRWSERRRRVQNLRCRVLHLMKAQEVGLLPFAELGLSPPKLAIRLRHRHAFTGPGANRGGFKFRDHAQDVEQQLSNRVMGIVDTASYVEDYAHAREFVGNIPCVRQGPCQPVKFGDNGGVAVAARSHGLFQTGPVSFSAGKSVVDVDHLVVNSQGMESMTLGGEVLTAGRAAGITDGHDWAVAYKAPSPGINSGGVYGNPALAETRRFGESRWAAPARPMDDRLTAREPRLAGNFESIAGLPSISIASDRQ